MGKVKGDLEDSLKMAGLETWRKVHGLGAHVKGWGYENVASDVLRSKL